MPHLTIQMGPPGTSANVAVPLASGTGTANTLGPAIKSPVGAASGTGAAYLVGADPAWAIDLRTAMASGISYTTTTTGVVSWTGAQLNSQINSVGNGTNATNRKRLVVSPGSTITLTGTDGIYLASRSYFELILTGVNITLSTDGASNTGSGLFFQSSTYVAVRGGTFQGQNPNTATAEAPRTLDEQKNAAVIRYGCDHIELDSITWYDLEGFGVITNSDGNDTGPAWPQYIWVHDCYIEGGEMGMAAVSGRYLLWEENTIAESSWFAFDFEPDVTQQGYEHVLLQRNTIDRFGWEAFYVSGDPQNKGGHTHWLLAMNPADVALGCTMSDLTFRDNIISRGHVTSSDGTPDPVGLGGRNTDGGGLLVRADKTNTKTGVYITGNVSSTARTVSSGPMSFSNVNGLTVTGNTQVTLSSAPLVSYDASPSGTHTVTPNTVS